MERPINITLDLENYFSLNHPEFHLQEFDWPTLEEVYGGLQKLISVYQYTQVAYDFSKNYQSPDGPGVPQFLVEDTIPRSLSLYKGITHKFELGLTNEIDSNLSGRILKKLTEQRNDFNVSLSDQLFTSVGLGWVPAAVRNSVEYIDRGIDYFAIDLPKIPRIPHVYHGFHTIQVSGEIHGKDGEIFNVKKHGLGYHIKCDIYHASVNWLDGHEISDHVYQNGEYTINNHKEREFLQEIQFSIRAGTKQSTFSPFALREKRLSNTETWKTDGSCLLIRENLPLSFLSKDDYLKNKPADAIGIVANRTEYVQKTNERKFSNKIWILEKDCQTSRYQSGTAKECTAIRYPSTMTKDGIVINRCQTQELKSEFVDKVFESSRYFYFFNKITETFKPGEKRIKEQITERRECVSTVETRVDQQPFKITMKQINDHVKVEQKIYKREIYNVHIRDEVNGTEHDSCTKALCGFQTTHTLKSNTYLSHGFFGLLLRGHKSYEDNTSTLREVIEIVKDSCGNAVCMSSEEFVTPTFQLYRTEKYETGYLRDKTTHAISDKDKKLLSQSEDTRASAGVVRATSSFAAGVTNLVLKSAVDGQRLTKLDAFNVGISTIESYAIGLLSSNAFYIQAYGKGMCGLAVVGSAATIARHMTKERRQRNLLGTSIEAVADITPAALQLICVATNFTRASTICTAASVAINAVRTTNDYMHGNITREEALKRGVQHFTAIGVGMGASFLATLTFAELKIESSAVTLVMPAVISSIAVYGAMRFV